MGLMEALTRLDQRVLPRLARGLRRIGRLTQPWRLSPLTTVTLILVGLVAATMAWRMFEPPGGGADGASPVWVGVHEGDSIPQYIDVSRAELDRLATASPAEPIYALVSFADYLPPDRVATVARAADANRELATVAAHARVPLPRRQTELVRLPANRLPDDLIAAMAEVAERKALDSAAYGRLATLEPGAQLRALYESNAAVASHEATAYRGGCACIFALVVRATPALLVRLAQQREVRVVDAAQDVRQPDGAVFVAPLPEQADRVQPLPDDGLPSPTP